MVSEIVHSVLSDNTNRRVTTIEETATKTATTSTVKQPKKRPEPHEKTLLQPRPLPLSHPITNWWENPARYVAKERL